LAIVTIERYRSVAKKFLHPRFGCGVVDLRTLRAGDVIAFVQRQTKFMQPPALKCIATALRSFLRYAQYRGEVTTALAAAVPIAAAWTTTPAVPKAISPEHAQRAIAIPEQGHWLGQVVRGYFAYHAVPTNRSTVAAFHRYVVRFWHRTLRRRSQKDGFPWDRMPRLADDWLPQLRNFHPWPYSRLSY
jgi:hypothetical protein